MERDFKYVVPVGPVWNGLYSINTGAWRTRRPVIDKDLCNGCGLCFLYCPVFSIEKAGSSFIVNLSYCKGCGICAHECSKKAITMQEEGGK